MVRNSMLPTLHDVARHAGVSTSTASRVLGNHGSSKELTREKVLASAEALGYRPNTLARSMITGSTETIGVVCADMGSPFFAEALRGITDYAKSENFSTLIVNTDENLEAERSAIQLLLEKQVDGIIVSPADVQDVQHLIAAQQRGTSLVLFDRSSSMLDVDSVTVDDVAASTNLVSYLIRLGHTRIAIVTELRTDRESNWQKALDETGGPLDRRMLNPSSRRLLGYLHAHQRHGLDVDPALVARTGDTLTSSAALATERLLLLERPPTAIVAVDNTTSVGAFSTLRNHSIAIPEAISFVSFDNLDWTTLVSPRLSVVEQPVYSLGALAAELMIRRISGRGGEPREHLLGTRFIERSSARIL